jgi:hypothetical protein
VLNSLLLVNEKHLKGFMAKVILLKHVGISSPIEWGYILGSANGANYP